MNTDNIREAFEAWLTSFIAVHPPLNGEFDGEFFVYSDLDIQQRWTTWQAAHAASEKRIAELDEEKQNLKVANIDCNNWFDALKIDFDKLQADNKRLVEVVKSVEWQWETTPDRHEDGAYFCIECWKKRKYGHEKDCKLAQALSPTESLEVE